MSAIELMDPKMDAGMLSNQSHAKIKSIAQAIQVNTGFFSSLCVSNLIVIKNFKDKLIKIDDFTSEEKIAIVDNTLCNMVR